MRNLSELKLEIPSIDSVELRSILGGGDYSASSPISTSDDNPYVLGEVVVTPENQNVADLFTESIDNTTQEDTQDTDSSSCETGNDGDATVTQNANGVVIVGSQTDVQNINSFLVAMSPAMQNFFKASGVVIVVDPSLGKGGNYSVNTNTITLESSQVPGLVPLYEELAHLAQNMLGIDTNKPCSLGHSNIEFEASVISLCMGWQSSSDSVPSTNIESIYNYIAGIYTTGDGVIDLSQFSSQMDMLYADFLSQSSYSKYSDYDDPFWVPNWAKYFDALGLVYKP